MVSKSKITASVVKAFENTRELQSTVSYRQTKLGAYDPVTGLSADSQKKVNVGAFLKDIAESQSQLANAKAGDMMAVIMAADLALTPEVNDVVVRGKDEYDVIAVAIDGLNLVWKLHLRLK